MGTTNSGSILIFASCVVGTCSILCGCLLHGRGPILLVLKMYWYMFCFFSTTMVGVGIFTLGGEF